MKIALLHYSAPPVVGGVENVMGEHARLMARDGHDVQILAGRGASTGEQVGFTCLPLLDSRHPDVLAVKSELDLGVVSPAFEALLERIEAGLSEALAGTDVLIIHNAASLNKNLALTAALHRVTQRQPRLGTVLWHHDLAWTTPRYRGELHDGYPWDLLRQDWPWARQVVVSEMRRRELCELLGVPGERVRVIPNGIDPARFFKLEAQTAQFVEQLRLLDSGPLLLLPVRITPRKNIELALAALAELRARYPQAVLVVTGPLGPHNPANVDYFERLTGLRARLGLEQSAHFLAELTGEYLPDAVIADFYRLADALIMPSREEGFGIPLIEAGLSGIPVFCADIEPLQSLGGRYAFYFSPDAPPEVVAGLMDNFFSLSPIYGLRARVRGSYTWEQIYRQQIEPLVLSAKI